MKEEDKQTDNTIVENGKEKQSDGKKDGED